MPETFPKDQLVAALAEEWDALIALCSDLDDDQWDLPTECPGWSVKDNLSHIIGTERLLLGESAPEIEVSGDHIKNGIGKVNEVWIEERRSRAGAEVLAEFVEVTRRRLEALRAMTQSDFDAPSWTPAGESIYGRFMRIRVFDCWTHEQDMRQALGRPGHESGPVAELSLDEVATAIGFIVGKKGGAPTGTAVRIHLTGPLSRVLDVDVTDRARLVPTLHRDPTATVEMPGTLFMRLTAGRTTAGQPLADGTISIDGDEALGRQVAEHLAFTI